MALNSHRHFRKVFGTWRKRQGTRKKAKERQSVPKVSRVTAGFSVRAHESS
jgi:hypothetical protein